MADNLDKDLTEFTAYYPLRQYRFLRNSGVILIVTSPVVFLVQDGVRQAMAAAAFALGVGLTLWGWAKLRNPGKPAYVLLPQGLFIHIAKVRDVLVPWTEIRDIFSHDLGVKANGRAVPLLGTYKGVTMLLISQAFYDREIHVENAALRGPGWANVFVPWPSGGPDGGQGGVCIALHHTLLGVRAADLRRAVEQHWRSFGNPPAT